MPKPPQKTDFFKILPYICKGQQQVFMVNLIVISAFLTLFFQKANEPPSSKPCESYGCPWASVDGAIATQYFGWFGS
jgi:hypothetical protein